MVKKLSTALSKKILRAGVEDNESYALYYSAIYNREKRDE
jgi:hypothetical protein